MLDHFPGRPRVLSLALLLLLSGCVSIPPELRVAPPDTSLARRVASIARKTGARFGISAVHIESGRRLDWNAEETFEGASTIKIALLAEAAARVSEARLDLNDRWRLTTRAVAAGSGMLDEFDPGLMPTNRDLLRLMIAISDNTAANLFIDRFGAEAVNARMAGLGLSGIRLVGRIPDRGQEPDRWPPLGSMTPRDTAEFLRRAATSTLLGPEPDRLVLDMLRTQHTKDRLFRLLDRKGHSWAGKSGTYGRVRNDAGILTTPKGRFVLVAFVDRIPESGVDGTKLAMGEIGAAVVDAWSRTLPDLPPVPDSRPPRDAPGKVEPVSALVLHVRLVGALTALFDLQAPWIAGHEHIAPDRKDDPGVLFPWDEIERRGLEVAERLRNPLIGPLR